MHGAAESQHFVVRASDGQLCDPTEVVFPVFRTENDGRLHFLATGFFITRLGWFATARHVIEDVVGRARSAEAGMAILQFLPGNMFYVRPVIAASCHAQADVAIGVCAPMRHNRTGEPLYNKFLTLALLRLEPGCPVWTYAYPGTTVTPGVHQEVAIDPQFYMGDVRRYYPEGRDRVMHPAPCYETTMTLHSASSGGPVFGPGGCVVGVNSSSFSGSEDVSFISRIVDAFPLGIENVVLPGEDEPKRVTIKDLIAINHVAVKGRRRGPFEGLRVSNGR